MCICSLGSLYKYDFINAVPNSKTQERMQVIDYINISHFIHTTENNKAAKINEKHCTWQYRKVSIIKYRKLKTNCKIISLIQFNFKNNRI